MINNYAAIAAIVHKALQDSVIAHYKRSEYMCELIRLLRDSIDLTVDNYFAFVPTSKRVDNISFYRFTGSKYLSMGMYLPSGYNGPDTDASQIIDDVVHNSTPLSLHHGTIYVNRDKYILDINPKYLEEQEELDNKLIHTCPDMLLLIAEMLLDLKMMVPVSKTQFMSVFSRYCLNLDLI